MIEAVIFYMVAIYCHIFDPFDGKYHGIRLTKDIKHEWWLKRRARRHAELLRQEGYNDALKFEKMRSGNKYYRLGFFSCMPPYGGKEQWADYQRYLGYAKDDIRPIWERFFNRVRIAWHGTEE